MKRLRAFLAFSLCILLLLSALIPYKDINPAHAAEQDFGYIYVKYVDRNSGQEIYPFLTQPVPLTNGTATYTLPVIGVPGYGYQYSTVNGVANYAQDIITVNVTSANTVNNPVRVIMYYVAKTTSKTVTVHGVALTPDNREQIFDTKTTTHTYYGTPITVQTNAPTPPNPNWEFLYGKIGINGTPINNDKITVTITGSDIEVYYYFRATASGRATVMIVATDNVLDPINNIVINEPDGRDYFARRDISKEIDGYELVTVSSPSGGRAGYEFAFAVVETGSGNPNNALVYYISKHYQTTITVPITTDSARWYIHFYWVREGTAPGGPQTPGSGGISFNPNSTLWTNQGKTGNGNGAYPVNVSYTGQHPAIGQGVAVYTHIDYKTVTTGNPPQEVTIPVVTNYSITFPVSFSLDRIVLSGASSDVIYGSSGTAYIRREGANLSLSAQGYWKSPSYTIPSPSDPADSLSSLTIPPAPANPTGSSGSYNIDWTDPVISFSIRPGIITNSSGAKVKNSQKGDPAYKGFFGDISVYDNLSGVAQIMYGWTFGPSESGVRYETIYSSYSPTGGPTSVVREIEKPVGDNLYLHVRATDVAGNSTYAVFGPYEDPIFVGGIRITNIKDPSWDGYFYNKKTGQPTGRYFTASQLPVDKWSFPGQIYVKKGYSFEFDLMTEYLYRKSDYVTIDVKFYHYDGKNRGQEVDLYYWSGNNPYVKAGSAEDKFVLHRKKSTDPPDFIGYDIGGLTLLRLSDSVRLHHDGVPYNAWKDRIQYNSGKVQYWYGKYMIPHSSIIVPKGERPIPENHITDGYILINFNITAWKNGAESMGTNQIYRYVPTQWIAEGGPKSPTFEPGDVMIYDARKSILNDFKTNVIW